MNSTATRICAIAADILGIEAEELGPQSGLDVTDGWDSIQHLSIMMDVEAEFGARFSPGELAQLQTVEQIAAKVDVNN